MKLKGATDDAIEKPNSVKWNPKWIQSNRKCVHSTCGVWLTYHWIYHFSLIRANQIGEGNMRNHKKEKKVYFLSRIRLATSLERVNFSTRSKRPPAMWMISHFSHLLVAVRHSSAHSSHARTHANRMTMIIIRLHCLTGVDLHNFHLVCHSPLYKRTFRSAHSQMAMLGLLFCSCCSTVST